MERGFEPAYRLRPSVHCALRPPGGAVQTAAAPTSERGERDPAGTRTQRCGTGGGGERDGGGGERHVGGWGTGGGREGARWVGRAVWGGV